MFLTGSNFLDTDRLLNPSPLISYFGIGYIDQPASDYCEEAKCDPI